MSTNLPLVLAVPHFDWATFRLKMKTTLTSRKFWTMLASLLIIWGARELAPVQVTLLNAVQLTIAALGLWSTGVAIEGIGANNLVGLLNGQPGQIIKAQVIRLVQAWLIGRGINLDVAAVEQMLEQVATAAAKPPAL